jgi:hypothetical protein
MQIDQKVLVQVPVPFLRGTIGLGDVVAKAIGAIGVGAIGVKPCTPCEERKHKMNQALQFRGWKA